MSPDVARLLKDYAYSVVPKVAQQRFPAMVDNVQRWLKRWWVRDMSHKERGRFRKIAERGGPLPDRFRQIARSIGLIVEWPPPSKPKPTRGRHWGKPKSWRTKHYRRRK